MAMDIAEARIWRKTPTKKNPASLIVAMVCNSEDLGTWSRSIRHKGGDTNTIAARPFTQEERNQQATAYRLTFHMYAGWKALIVDEFRVTKDANWIEKLLQISRLNTPIEDIIIEALMKR